MWLLALVLLTVLFNLFDVWYFIRGALAFLRASFQPKVKDILKEQVYSGVVLFQDIDFYGHMNNSRYLRECDFARFSLYTRNGIFDAMRSLKANMVLGASTIRYRRSLLLLEHFEIRSRILSWDEKAFYVEQRFVSQCDGFLCAIMLCRQNVLRSTPDATMQFLCKRKVGAPLGGRGIHGIASIWMGSAFT
ncbi:protein THEM6 [Latimeria chalumnae]|uniref:Protein THEM6 n=1 Tax=Latimeria chalumnae TaxID=7897 RepID=H3B6C2_LATCH|nr:PREDICTED: protein THEM6 [Latimeria chalumnae]XP_014344227.1 PREDICTED: protein THEM6 [Latimeria chalumnae]|eukprot:XP_014344226.1 PREDICTED: protein THEM6 [Latimeria chalumnae]